MGRNKTVTDHWYCFARDHPFAGRTGGCYIDATMGKGNDTLFLCELAGEKWEGTLHLISTGSALDATRELLRTHTEKSSRAELILTGMSIWTGMQWKRVQMICFNFRISSAGIISLQIQDHQDQHRGIGKVSAYWKHVV